MTDADLAKLEAIDLASYCRLCPESAGGVMRILVAEARPLTWTVDPPTQPGWYWCKSWRADPEVIHVAAIEEMDDTLCVWWESQCRWAEVGKEVYTNCQWAGPLVPPPG